jgi:hypothetical protein
MRVLVCGGALELLVTEIIGGPALEASISPAVPLVDPEIPMLVRGGRAPVLVMLRVIATGDQAQRADAIGRAQDELLAQLPQSHAAVVRRYASVAMLALEIDATALQVLETMTDIVAAVKLDRMAKPQ